MIFLMCIIFSLSFTLWGVYQNGWLKVSDTYKVCPTFNRFNNGSWRNWM